MGTEYTPHTWMLQRNEEGSIHVVVASWSGGYLGSDSWRRSSQIVNVHCKDDHYEVHTTSGSVYRCYKEAVGASAYTLSVFSSVGDYLIGDEVDIAKALMAYTIPNEEDVN